MTLSLYDDGRDREALQALWMEALGETWPLADVSTVLVAADDERFVNGCFVARDARGLAGIVAAQTERGSGDGALRAIVVAPRAQRTGVGTALHTAAIEWLRGQGVGVVQLGGGVPRIWPGVPENLPGVRDFCEALGWESSDTSYDLVKDLRAGDGGVLARRETDAPVQVMAAAVEDKALVLDFVRRALPSWLGDFESVIAAGDLGDIVTARTHDGRIVGALIMSSPQSNPERREVPWTLLLGRDVGSVGDVGVATEARGAGIGTALVAGALELQRERGVGHCFAGWTELTEFYGLLGFRTWRSYAMSWRELERAEAGS